jgi:hypothetical protein
VKLRLVIRQLRRTAWVRHGLRGNIPKDLDLELVEPRVAHPHAAQRSIWMPLHIGVSVQGHHTSTCLCCIRIALIIHQAVSRLLDELLQQVPSSNRHLNRRDTNMESAAWYVIASASDRIQMRRRCSEHGMKIAFDA